ncbi:hypothetical protein, partial [Stenotrophomonas muris]|uniref:hypothetical protein n=1 Tax=Stenotrophomonas muris TaxID=2963283 RepID=UPI00300F1E09
MTPDDFAAAERRFVIHRDSNFHTIKPQYTTAVPSPMKSKTESAVKFMLAIQKQRATIRKI